MTGVLTESQPVGEERPEPAAAAAPDRSLRRFVVAVTVALGAVTIPYLWVLWDLWTGGLHGLRSVAPANFYALQARAMFHGHLYVPPHSLGLEGFIHDGHEYTYFGIFPSLLRMPVLALTHSLDGQLTAPLLLVAWVATGLGAAGVLWRLRVMLRGSVLVSRAEAATYGLLVAAVTGGSVLMYLAATPFVYDEDFAWSVVLTLASLFALLGVVERRSAARVVWAAVFIVFANLDRSPTGYACTIGALLVAGWLGWGRAGRDQRRWAVPVALEEAALLDGMSKFGIFLRITLPLTLPGITVAAILSGIFAWNDLLYAFIMTPSTGARTGPVVMMSFLGGYIVPWQTVMACAVMICAPVVVGGIAIHRYIARGLTLGAVK